MRKKKAAIDKIPNMSEKELKKLRRNLTKVENKARDHQSKKRQEYHLAIDSSERIYKLQNKVKYFIGKAKAMKCPAFKSKTDYLEDARCWANNDTYWYNNYRRLFSRGCHNCKLSKKEALRQASFNYVFKKEE